MRRRLPPVANTFTGITHLFMECRDCGWQTGERNGLGLANQHARRTGHHVSGDQCITVAYNVPK